MSGSSQPVYEEPRLDIQDDDEYEEEEVEVTDDETEEQPVVTPTAKPGKVEPSSAVKGISFKSPETAPKSQKSSLNPAKNPFPLFGAWSQKDLSEIEIVFPVLGSKQETTNEKTRESRPEARYWKAPITFKYNNWTSETIRFDNVHVPHNQGGRDYGSGFVYLCLPGFVGDRFADAGKTRRPTIVTEKSLIPDGARWWKIANNVNERFGVLNNTTNLFQAKPLTTIFETTQRGLTVNLIAKFYCKASTDERLPLKPTTPCTVAIEVVRAFISNVNVDVETPARVSRSKPKSDPAATKMDVASDDLMKRLSELGL